MAVVTAAVTGAVGVGASIAGGLMTKSAIGDAANAQIAASNQALQQQIDERRRITDQALQTAQMSPDEIKSINSLLNTKGMALTSTLDSINKQQAQLDAMDPNVKAAGQDLYKLMTGQAAQILAPMQKQLDMDRANRMNQLAQQLGPGFMTTSAGIEAMNKFDTQSSLAINQAQQSALGQMTQTYLGLTGQQQQGQASVTGGIGNAFAQSQNADQAVLAGYQNVQGRLTNAQLGASSQPINFQAPAQVAGNQFAGGQAFGQQLSGLGGGLGQVAGQVYGQNLFANAIKGTQNTTTSNGTNLALPSASSFGTPTGNQIGSMFATGKLSDL